MKIFIFFTILLSCQLVWSLDLKEARKQGFVFEEDSGYLKSLSPGANDLVIEVNKKRKKYYMQISSKNGKPLQEVASRAAAKLKKKNKK